MTMCRMGVMGGLFMGVGVVMLGGLAMVLGRMLMTKPPDVATERPDLGTEAAAMIMRCILADANSRFATASEVTAAWLAAAQTPLA